MCKNEELSLDFSAPHRKLHVVAQSVSPVLGGRDRQIPAVETPDRRPNSLAKMLSYRERPSIQKEFGERKKERKERDMT